jgi:hypothetical protein
MCAFCTAVATDCASSLARPALSALSPVTRCIGCSAAAAITRRKLCPSSCGGRCDSAQVCVPLAPALLRLELRCAARRLRARRCLRAPLAAACSAARRHHLLVVAASRFGVWRAGVSARRVLCGRCPSFSAARASRRGAPQRWCGQQQQQRPRVASLAVTAPLDGVAGRLRRGGAVQQGVGPACERTPRTRI